MSDGRGTRPTKPSPTGWAPTKSKTMTSLLHCSKLMPQGRGLAKVLVQRASAITLDWDTRQKSRFDATDSTGRALGCSCRVAPWCAAAMYWWPKTAR